MIDDISHNGHDMRVAGSCGSLWQISSTRMALAVALHGAEAVGAEMSLIDVREYALLFSDGKHAEARP